MLIGLLCGAVDGNDEAVQPGGDRLAGLFRAEVMGIGRGGSIDPPAGSIAHHIQKLRVQIGLSLKVKSEVPQGGCQLVNHRLKALLLQHARGAGEAPQTTGALRAAQVAARRRLKSQRDGHPAHLCFAQQARPPVATCHAPGIGPATHRALAQQVANVSSMAVYHLSKLVPFGESHREYLNLSTQRQKQ